jgi:transcription termination factor Rho
MLKSSSLCLYSSNLGTFWIKIEQFWPFEEVSIFSNGGTEDITARMIDLVAPFGKGQRGLLVAPPKAGKTMIMQNIGNGIISTRQSGD